MPKGATRNSKTMAKARTALEIEDGASPSVSRAKDAKGNDVLELSVGGPITRSRLRELGLYVQDA